MIYEFKKTMYKYGIIFYDFKADHEMRFYFYAYSAFDADSGTAKLEIDGYSKGEVTFIDENNSIYWVSATNLFHYFTKELNHG